MNSRRGRGRPQARFTGGTRRQYAWGPIATTAEPAMAKGMDQKKQDKKKPEKTLKEKRAEKKEKNSGK
jgi:hypothetical protein